MPTLRKLKKAIDRNFSPPFLPEGLVTAKFVEGPGVLVLQIKIGARDIWITESGRVTASGSDVSDINPTVPLKGASNGDQNQEVPQGLVHQEG